MKVKAHVPAPTSYDMRKGFEVKRNVMNQKAERLTIINEHVTMSKKNNYPDPAQYKLQYHRLSQEMRPPGNIHRSEARVGYLQEIGYLASLENPCKVHDKNYK